METESLRLHSHVPTLLNIQIATGDLSSWKPRI